MVSPLIAVPLLMSAFGMKHAGDARAADTERQKSNQRNVSSLIDLATNPAISINNNGTMLNKPWAEDLNQRMGGQNTMFNAPQAILPTESDGLPSRVDVAKSPTVNNWVQPGDMTTGQYLPPEQVGSPMANLGPTAQQTPMARANASFAPQMASLPPQGRPPGPPPGNRSPQGVPMQPQPQRPMPEGRKRLLGGIDAALSRPPAPMGGMDRQRAAMMALSNIQGNIQPGQKAAIDMSLAQMGPQDIEYMTVRDTANPDSGPYRIPKTAYGRLPPTVVEVNNPAARPSPLPAGPNAGRDAKILQYESELGLSRPEAIKYADNLISITPPDSSGRSWLVDEVSGATLRQLGVGQASSGPGVVQEPIVENNPLSIRGGLFSNLENAYGFGNRAREAAESATFGTYQASPEVNQSRQQAKLAREAFLGAMARSGRPSTYAQQRVEELIPESGFTGNPQRAWDKWATALQMANTEEAWARNVLLDPGISREMRAETLAQIASIEEMRRILGDPSEFGRPGEPVRIKNDSDYEALPSGATFIDPEGKKRVKP